MKVSIVIQCYNEKNTIEKFFWNRLSNMFINLNLTDMETGYKAFRASLIKSIRIEEDGFVVKPEITAKLARIGCRIYQVGISYLVCGSSWAIIPCYHESSG